MIPPIKQLKAATKRQKCLRELFVLARAGNARALNKLRTDYQLKFYTQEEVRVIERLLAWRKQVKANRAPDTEVVNVREQELTIDVMPYYENTTAEVAQINWLQQLEDSQYYLAGITFLTGKARGSSDEWVLKLDKTVGFRPLFSTLNWIPSEKNRYLLARAKEIEQASPEPANNSPQAKGGE